MLDIKVYFSLEQFCRERSKFKKYIRYAFGKKAFQSIYGIDFLYCALTQAQFSRMGGILTDCIISKRFENKLTGWRFLVSTIIVCLHNLYYMYYNKSIITYVAL